MNRRRLRRARPAARLRALRRRSRRRGGARATPCARPTPARSFGHARSAMTDRPGAGAAALPGRGPARGPGAGGGRAPVFPSVRQIPTRIRLASARRADRRRIRGRILPAPAGSWLQFPALLARAASARPSCRPATFPRRSPSGAQDAAQPAEGRRLDLRAKSLVATVADHELIDPAVSSEPPAVSAVPRARCAVLRAPAIPRGPAA